MDIIYLCFNIIDKMERIFKLSVQHNRDMYLHPTNINIFFPKKYMNQEQTNIDQASKPLPDQSPTSTHEPIHISDSNFHSKSTQPQPQHEPQPQQNYKTLYLQQKKKVSILQHQLELQKIKIRKLMANNNAKNKGKICMKCCMEIKEGNNTGKKDGVENIKEDKKEMIGFSKKIEELLKKNNEKVMNSSLTSSTHKKKQLQQLSIINSIDLQNFQSKASLLSLSKQSSLSNPFPMVQNFTIFGISQPSISIQSKQQNLQPLQGQLLYSYNQPSDVDKQAGRLIFPNGVGLKRLKGQRARDKAIQIMSYSYQNVKSFVLRFKCQDNVDQEQYDKNQFLKHINPAKSLFCLCIGISQFTTIQPSQNIPKKQPCSTTDAQSLHKMPQSSQQKNPSTTSMSQQNQKSSQSLPSSSNSIQKSTQTQKLQKQLLQIYLSQRVFCISSYYPFLSFYEEILRSLLNLVKMERLMMYKLENQNVGVADSKFHGKRMEELFITTIRDLNAKKVSFNHSYQLKLQNQSKIILQTDWNLAKNFFIQQWIFPILNMFTIDTFIDLITLMMLQDRIVFICNNSHILTYTIFLFTNIIVKPFVYAFEVVSIIPEEDFLGAPFPVVYGMLRKRKDVESSKILQEYKNTYVFLSPDKVDIVYTESKKNLLKHRPQKLKSDLTQLFKDLKKPRQQSQKPARYELETVDYPQNSTIEQRQISVSIIEHVNQYILQEVINRIPNQYQIRDLKNSIENNYNANVNNGNGVQGGDQDRDQHTILMEKIKEIVKKNVKESFVERLLDTQMISNFVCK